MADERGDHADQAEHRELAADEGPGRRVGRALERHQREAEGERPLGRLVARGRRDAHRADDGEDRERESALRDDEAREAPHRRAPDRRTIGGEAREMDRAIHGRECQDRNQQGDFQEQQAPVPGSDESGDRADVRHRHRRA